MRNEIIEKLTNIINEYIPEENNNLSETTNLHTELGLSSLELVSMIGDVEDTFGIELPDTEITKLITVGDIADFIESNT